MRQSIFKKAELLKEKVKHTGDARGRKGKISYFEVEDVLIEIICDGKKTFVNSCTCTHCSVHDGRSQRRENRLTLCSYKIAVLKALPMPTIFNKEPIGEGQKLFVQ